MTKAIGCYLRVSTVGQNEAGQRLEIQRWLDGNGIEPSRVRWLIDKKSGDNLNRPAFEQLQAAVFAGEVDTIVVFRLDRISRSLRDGVNVLGSWCEKKLRVVSISERLDFSGPVGQLVAALLFALAAVEQQARRERQQSGIRAAKAAGVRWGGSKPGRRTKATPEKIGAIHQLKSEGVSVAAIARTVALHRSTIYSILNAG